MINYFFIHIPKTGGTFVTKRLVNPNDNVFTLGHGTCLGDGSDVPRTFKPNLLNHEYFEESIKFTIIRNPYSLLVSYFISRWGDNDLGMKNKLPNLPFNELVNLFCNKEKKWHIDLFREFLYFQLFDKYGNSRCDYAIIYDNLSYNLEEFSKKHNLKFVPGGYENKTHKKTNNYKDYYDSESIDLINQKCKLELEMFNFDFNGYNGKENIIKMSDYKINWSEIIKI